MKRYVVIDKKMSVAYYAYMLYLVDTESKKYLDSERYGDLNYWGINEFIPYIDALLNLLARNKLSISDVEIVSDSDVNVSYEKWVELLSIVWSQ